ncbi:hypothetical protein EJ08DRAFT_173946 [Tothia fuscella]|uniref:Uncharacterized protein n=1 Tax=Tothia fuscella TaxID=1048955 RepID=A0A9P4U0A1_9PEZI|nr:hypothetical protein EJ08DRAFT_173946 [Tothia fuscella]
MKYYSAFASHVVLMSTLVSAVPKRGDPVDAADPNLEILSASSFDDITSISSAPALLAEVLPTITGSSSSSTQSSVSITRSPAIHLSSSVCTPKFKTFNTSSVYYTSTIVYSAMTTFFPTVKLEQACTRSTSLSLPSMCDHRGIDGACSTSSALGPAASLDGKGNYFGL